MFKYGINSCLFTRASHLHEGVYGKGVPEVMHLRTMMVAEARDSADVEDLPELLFLFTTEVSRKFNTQLFLIRILFCFFAYTIYTNSCT